CNRLAALHDGAVTVTARDPAFPLVSGTANITVSGALLESLAISPDNAILFPSESQVFHAVGTFSDGSTHDLSDGLVWTSDHPDVVLPVEPAAFQLGFFVQALLPGTATLTATHPLRGHSASVPVTVSTAALTAIVVNPDNSDLAPGQSERFTATGIFADRHTQDLTDQVYWTSSLSTAAVIDPVQSGVLHALHGGVVTLTARDLAF